MRLRDVVQGKHCRKRSLIIGKTARIVNQLPTTITKGKVLGIRDVGVVEEPLGDELFWILVQLGIPENTPVKVSASGYCGAEEKLAYHVFAKTIEPAGI